MKDFNNININEIPKEFMDGAFIGHNKSIFFLVVTNGEVEYGFCTTPEQMKLTQIMINNNIAIYERDHGPINVIKVNKDKPIVSPIQFSSLGGDDELKDGDKI